MTYQEITIKTLQVRISGLIHIVHRMDVNSTEIDPVLGEIAHLQYVLSKVCQDRQVGFDQFKHLSEQDQQLYTDIGRLLFNAGFTAGYNAE